MGNESALEMKLFLYHIANFTFSKEHHGVSSHKEPHHHHYHHHLINNCNSPAAQVVLLLTRLTTRFIHSFSKWSKWNCTNTQDLLGLPREKCGLSSRNFFRATGWSTTTSRIIWGWERVINYAAKICVTRFFMGCVFSCWRYIFDYWVSKNKFLWSPPNCYHEFAKLQFHKFHNTIYIHIY